MLVTGKYKTKNVPFEKVNIFEGIDQVENL